MEILEKGLQSDVFRWSLEIVSKFGLPEKYSYYLNTTLLLIALYIVLHLVDFLLRKVILIIISNLISKSKTELDDVLTNNRVLQYVTHIVPILIAKAAIPLIFMGFPRVINSSVKIIDILLIITFCLLARNVLRAFRDVLRMKSAFADKPLDSYTQVSTILLYGIGAVLIYSVITGDSPKSFLVSLGAASAILILVFKDTILGFVASIQVSSNDMIRVGDWIEMTKYGADGTVVQINLSSVKVQNFDKTITTIPTYAMISDSFKNYRGMQNSGGRRIKRSINIKLSTIRFLEEHEIEELKRIALLRPYIEKRTEEIDKFNAENLLDTSVKVNGRRMTNVGLFREYIKEYTYNNPNIHKDFYFLVRQMQSTEYGLPMELYMFTTTTVWAEYEAIMSDIFDHLFAVVPYFKLEVFELPASDDVRGVLSNVQKRESE